MTLRRLGIVALLCLSTPLAAAMSPSAMVAPGTAVPAGPLPQNDGGSGADAPDECTPHQPAPVDVRFGVDGQLVAGVDRADVYALPIREEFLGAEITVNVRSWTGERLHDLAGVQSIDAPLSVHVYVHRPDCSVIAVRASLVSAAGHFGLDFTPDIAGVHHVRLTSSTPGAHADARAASTASQGACDPCLGWNAYHTTAPEAR